MFTPLIPIVAAACTALSIKSTIDKPRLLCSDDSRGLLAGRADMAENMVI